MRHFSSLLLLLGVLPSSLLAQPTAPIRLQPAQLQLPAGAIPVDVGVMRYPSILLPSLLIAAQGTNTIYTATSFSPQRFGIISRQYPALQPLSLVPMRFAATGTTQPDFVVLTANGDVTPWRYNGLYTAGTPVALRQGLACAPTDRLVVGEFHGGTLSGQGGLDLACWSNGAQPGFSRAQNTGNGVFQALPRVGYTTIATTTMATANLYGDPNGLEDALVPLPGFRRAQFMIWQHSRNASSPTTSWLTGQVSYPDTPARYVTSVAAGDVNGDGTLDVVTAGAVVAVQLGTLLGATQYFVATAPDTLQLPSLALARDVRLADLNGDNRPELLVLSTDGTFSVFENTSRTSPTLYNPVPLQYLTGVDPALIRVADADNDGDLDILIPCRGDHSLTLLWNGLRGLGTTSAVPSVPIEAYPNPAKTALHLRGDGTEGLSAAATLLDLTGRVVRQWPTTRAPLPVGDLPRGVYVVRVTTPAAPVTQRVVFE